MSERYVFPELFYAAGAPVVVDGRRVLALRWMLHPSLGLPRAHFHVWRRTRDLPMSEVHLERERLDSGVTLLTWAGGPAAAVLLTVTVPMGSALTLRAWSSPAGTGHVLDEETLTGPVSGARVVLVGSPVASVTLGGGGDVGAASLVPLYDLVNDDGWALVERVGLPVDRERFAGTGYPLEPQGPVGAEQDPVDAAVSRVRAGTPSAGWSPMTDRGVAVPPWVAPDARELVHEIRPALVDPVADLLAAGADRPVAWQEQAEARVPPLSALLLAAGTDPFAALALGFGATVPLSDRDVEAAPRSGRLPAFYMVTVEHKLSVKIQTPIPFEARVEGELVALWLEARQSAPGTPLALRARRRSLDRPAGLDQPWLEAVQLSWALPPLRSATMTRATSYAIARAASDEEPEILLQERRSGGWFPWTPAWDARQERDHWARFTEPGSPERFPGEPEEIVYSAAAQDWFGRWSAWASVDHTRVVVAPQVPAVRTLELIVAEGAGPTRSASALLELTWDWTDRSPERIRLRLLVHAEGAPPPDVDGSVLSVGGPIVADTVLDFAAATPDLPPQGLELVPEEEESLLGRLRTWRVRVEGLSLAFADAPRVRVTARARASERVRPGVEGDWSPPATAQAVNPVPPPPVEAPAGMSWAELPDARGASRVTLRWDPSPGAAAYAVHTADEAALRSEAGLPAADLDVPAADRLPALRALDLRQLRRAFRRLVERQAGRELTVELPRGSRLIHFYAVLPLSETGVPGELPASANQAFAVAAPALWTPEMPRLTARERDGRVSLRVEVPEAVTPAARVAIYRFSTRDDALVPEAAGPPLLVADALDSVLEGDSRVWALTDPSPGPAWRPVWYRAVAWSAGDPGRGEIGAASVPSRAVSVVVTAAGPPPLLDLRLEDVADEPDFRLLSFVSDVPLLASQRGVFALAVRVILPGGASDTVRVRADALPLHQERLPTPTEAGELIFRHDPADPPHGRNYAWIPREAIGAVVEVTDPVGRSSRLGWEAP